MASDLFISFLSVGRLERIALAVQYALDYLATKGSIEEKKGAHPAAAVECELDNAPGPFWT